MVVSTVLLKIKQRLNKLASNDYSNIECWHIVEAFNKAQVEWVRRQLHGMNQTREGAEQSVRRIDDLQLLLTERALGGRDRGKYFESNTLPSNYLEFNHVSAQASTECCGNRTMTVYLAEEANGDQLLIDVYKKPSFEWGETFCTILSNKIRIYTNNEFSINQPVLTYYRQPIKIEVQACLDPYTLVSSPIDIHPEFKDDIVELLIDDAAAIIAGDMESWNQSQLTKTRNENNN